MSEVQSPTDTGADQDSSDIRDESPLEQNQQDQSADYDEGTDSSQEQDSHSEESQENTSNTETNQYDEKLAKFAKSQGIDDLSEATDRERSLLKVAYDNRVAARSKKPEKEVKDTVGELYKNGSSEADRINRLEARLATQDFFSREPEARTYEGEMSKLILQEQEQYGDDAARHLAGNLPRLLKLAKLEAGAYDSDAARESGRRDEREKLRKAQEGSSNTGNASSSIDTTKAKLTRESIDNMTEEEYASRRGEIDEAISRGELY